MKVLIIGGNRFVGLRVAQALDAKAGVELHLVNRTGQVPTLKNANVFKADRRNLNHSHLDREYDVIIDFAAFDERDANSSLGYFRQVGRYLYISTMSVYPESASLAESEFDSQLFDISAPPPTHDYQSGKRWCEATFTQKAPFPLVSVRFPLILGPDDYTRRLEFHVERIEAGRPIHIPNLDARISMIHAEDAAKFLLWSMTQTFTGPLNVASAQPLALRNLIQRIERTTGKKAILINQPSPQASSPYGPDQDWFMDTKKMEKLGFKTRPIESWIDDLIAGARINPGPTRH